MNNSAEITWFCNMPMHGPIMRGDTCKRCEEGLESGQYNKCSETGHGIYEGRCPKCKDQVRDAQKIVISPIDKVA